MKKNKKKVLDLSDITTGTIESWTIENAIVTKLVYRSGNGIKVTYENYEYKVGDSESTEKATVADKVDQLLNTVSDVLNKVGILDSGAGELSNSYSEEALKLLKEAGLDPEKLNAKSWQFAKKDGPFFYWSTLDISTMQAGTKVPVMRYNYTTGTYTVWMTTVQEKHRDNTDTRTYLAFEKYAGYTASTSQSKDKQTFDNMEQLYQQALQECN